MTTSEKRLMLAALAASARAFDKAKTKGYVWISDDGTYQTYEMFDGFRPSPGPNPDQLTID